MTPKTRAEELERLLEPCVNALGFDLWGVELHSFRGRSRLCVYIDSSEGITADDCETASAQLGPLLDVAGNMPDRYTLEVSSPGLDRILFKPEHFDKSRGKEITLRLYAPMNGMSRIAGVLAGVAPDEITIAAESGEIRIELARVRRARIVPRF